MKDTKEKHWYSIFIGSKFTDEKYREDKQNIIARYLDDGYRDAKIVHDTVYKYNDRRINIDLKIDEIFSLQSSIFQLRFFSIAMFPSLSKVIFHRTLHHFGEQIEDQSLSYCSTLFIIF